MDTIKFIIGEPYDTHTCAKGVDVALYLNDTKVPHNILNTPQVLAAHTFKFAEFDLYTCDCGVPGCAGFHSQVVQTKHGDTVTWTFPESNDYKTDKKIYNFDVIAFNSQFKDLLANLLKLEKQGIYDTVLICRDYGDEPSTQEDPQSIVKSFDWYGTRYQATQNQQEMLEKECPEMIGREFFFVYDGSKGKYPYEFTSLIGKIINQFPCHINEPYYLAKCKLVIKAIKEALNGDNTRFHKIANNTYTKQDATAFWLIDWNFDGVTEENFELSKLGIVLKRV